jgi:hypothetical protein
MYTDGPEMNFRTESLDFPQKEQRRCLSWDMSFLNRGQIEDERWRITPSHPIQLSRLDPHGQAKETVFPWEGGALLPDKVSTG